MIKIPLDEQSINDLSKKIGRSCGGCTLCCFLLFIPELNKPKRSVCPNSSCNGCEVYDSRPQSCRNFTCEWLVNPDIGDDWYPQKSGLVIFFSENNGQVFLNFHCRDEGSWKKEPYHSQIKFYARYGIENSLFKTVVHEGTQKMIINGV